MKSDRGFTLVELMVVLAIIVAVTGVVFTSQSSFNKTLVLANTAYDVALTLRSAETYGLGSRVVSGAMNVGHGIHFEIGDTFILFADSLPSVGESGLCHTPPVSDPGGPDAQPGNCAYSTNESVKEYKLGNGITVSNFCTFSSGWNCASTGSLDIVFARPNPDPFMSVNGSHSSSIKEACITLRSAQGLDRYIGIASSGEITANATACPLP